MVKGEPMLDANRQPIIDPVTGQPVLELINVTQRRDFAARTIYATISSFSPFVLAQVRKATIDPIVGPDHAIAAGTSVSLSADFTDPNPADVHTAVWTWGDGTTSPGVISESDGYGTASATHVYKSAGMYTVSLSLTDNTIDGGAASATWQFVVVYDPEAGFVTGGGWIVSPAGALTSDAKAEGKATFDFVSRYRYGTTAPAGSIQFDLHASGFDFHGSSQEWLVITGSSARISGRGAVNGKGDYFFLLTAIDGGTGGDTFRLKVFSANGEVLYDNNRGAADNADPSTVFGGGSIVIHQ